MKRSTPLVRRTGLAPGAPLVRRTPLRQVSAKRRKENQKRRDAVNAAFPERPQCSVPWCRRFADDCHEPLMRSRGGSITDPNNMTPLCRPCHDVITDTQPDWAYELSLLVHSWEAEQ